MIDFRWVPLPEADGDYVRVAGKPCQLQYRVRMGQEVGWWIPCRLEEQLPTDKMQPFYDVPGMTDAQRLEANDFHREMERKHQMK